MGKAEAPLQVVVVVPVIAPADHQFEGVQLGWHHEQGVHSIQGVHAMVPLPMTMAMLCQDLARWATHSAKVR
jgi:hypothetical protein